MDKGIHHIDVVASSRVHHGVTVLARLADGMSTPGLCRTSAQLDERVGKDLRLVDGQRQDIDAVAAVGRGQRIVIHTACGQTPAAPAVRQIIAARACCLAEAVGRIHRQGQRIDAVATDYRLQTVVIDTRGSQALAMPIVRSLRRADSHRLSDMIARVHRKSQRVDAVATGCRLQAVVIDARLRQALTMPNVRHIVTAECLRLFVAVCRIHHQDKSVNAVTERDCLIVGIISASRCQCAIAPRVRKFVITNCNRVNKQICRINGHLNLIDIVAPLSIRHRVAINSALRNDKSAPCMSFTLTNIHRLGHIHIGRLHGQSQCIDTVTAIYSV